MRRRIAAFLAFLCWLAPQPSAKPDVREMLAAAAHSGLTPHAFYISAQRRVDGDASALYGAAQRCLRGTENAQVLRTVGDQSAVVAVAIVCPPDVRAAEENVRRLYSTLGRQAEIVVCLTGRSQASEQGALSLLILDALADVALEGIETDGFVSHTGEWAQVAIRKNGDAYLGVPLIPLDY